MSKLIKINVNGREALCTEEQANSIELLRNVQKGSIATVHGYKPSTNWVKRPTQNINFISRFSTTKLYERKLEALKNVSFEDIQDHIKDDEKLATAKTELLREYFDVRLNELKESLENSLRSEEEKVKNNHHLAHEKFYIPVGTGVKVNLETIKVNGETVLETVKGLPIVKSIMISMLELNTVNVVEGERKTVNSGIPVRIGKCIEKVLNKRSVGFKTLSLKADNFDSLSIGKQELTNEQVKSIGDLLVE